MHLKINTHAADFQVVSEESKCIIILFVWEQTLNKHHPVNLNALWNVFAYASIA